LTAIGNFVFITIANSSKDIPERDRVKIFDRFHRGDAARTRQVEGFGLGLSLSQEIARAHGGDLKLDRTYRLYADRTRHGGTHPRGNRDDTNPVAIAPHQIFY
jgi:signal transduction histidine kinase